MRRHMSLGLDDFRIIVALAEELNFHRAARKVGLTHSAVTRIVARVERYAGATLFERSHSKRQSVALTDAGRRYVERARLAIAHTDGAVLAARETLHGIDHQIVVGKSMYTDRRLISILRSMELPLYPKLEVSLETRLPGELPACVRSGEIDVAGPNLAGSLAKLGLIDEYRLYVHPIVLGSGQPFFAGPRPRLRLVASERIGADVIRLTYVPA